MVTSDVISAHANDSNRKLTDALIQAAEASIPRYKKTVKNKNNKFLPYFNESCITSIKSRNIARNKANKSKEINDRIEYKRLKGVAQRTC